MSQGTPPPVRRAPRPPRFNIKNLQPNSGSAMGSMPPSAQPYTAPPFTAQTNTTALGGGGGGGGGNQPYWPNYANPFAAGNFMAKGFEGFVDFTKSGMSFGEKFTYGLYNKFSKWSKKWFTHMFLFIVVTLYSVGGALLFGAIEGRQSQQDILEAHALQKSFFKSMRQLSADHETRKYSSREFDGQLTYILREHQSAVESLLNSNKTLEEIEKTKHPWSFWNAMFYCGTIYTTIGIEEEKSLLVTATRGPSKMDAANDANTAVVRRRRRIGRGAREKTPDPGLKHTNGIHRYSDDDSIQIDGTTASEETAQIVRMQIRPPGTMSAHESKILRRRDKSFASSAARSHSQPRQAERLSSPEVFDLLRANKRSLSSPRHKDDSSESCEVSSPVRKSNDQLHVAPIADENLNRLEMNLRRFEEERKRFESEKRLFEREKREHKLRHKQLHDLEERRRLLANYRKLSDRIQLPADDEERRRMVHSLRLQRSDAPSIQQRERARNRSFNYDESSTQFSSSDADAEDANRRRQNVKALSPVHRQGSAASNYSAPVMVRGPPPQPPVPERRSVSRNNSLSPIRPQRRSKTPEQRAEMMRKLAETSEGLSEQLVPVVPVVPASILKKPVKEPTPDTEVNLKDRERRSSLPKSEIRLRKRSLENIPSPKIETECKPIEMEKEQEPKPSTSISLEPTFLQKIARVFQRKNPTRSKEILSEETKEDITVPQYPSSDVPLRVFSMIFWRAFFKEARFEWKRLKKDYPIQVNEICCYRNKCISHTIILVMLCGFGGLCFRYTEGTSENIYKCEVRKVKRDFIDNLWTVSHNMREDDWKTLARQKLRKFEEELYALQDLGVRRYPGMKSWNFVNCILYCWTVITTIGYGHITPKTSFGQALTIVYAIIGIPMFLILLADFGKLFTRGMKFIWAYVRRLYYTGTCRQIRKQQQVRDAMSGINAVYDLAVRRPSQFFNMGPEVDVESQAASEGGDKSVAASHPETPTSPYPETFEIDDEFNLPVSVASVLLISYILIGAFVYTLWEDWTYFEAFYFVFISMSTIGFGDLVPNHPIFMMCSIIYLVFGLALTSMFINVVQIKLSDTFKQASAKIGATIGFGMASEVGDETATQMKTPSELASIHGSHLEKISEDATESPASQQPMPPSILRAPRPVSPMNHDGSASDSEPPPLMPKRQTFKEPQPEPEKKKKKGFFK